MKLKMFLLSICLLASSQASASVITGTLTQDFDHYYLSWAGGDFFADVLAAEWLGGPAGSGLADSTLALFVDDGSVGQLTGSLVAFNYDSNLGPIDNSILASRDGSLSVVDPYIGITNLAAGSYVLSVGTLLATLLDEEDTGIDAFPNSRNISQLAPLYFIGDYQLSTNGSISSVPVPAAAWLFGSGLIGLVGIAKRMK